MNKYKTWVWVAGITIALVGIEYWLGRLPICACGYVKLWQNEIMSSENSQHLMDWYTLSHIIHGFAFYALIWLVAKKWLKKNISLGSMFVMAIFIEAAWEVLENSPLIINYYRQNTVSLGYVGDSIINSVGDLLSMALGFWLAWKLPVKLSVALVILMELVALYFVRDNLFLNILMFIYPAQAVKDWQSALWM